MQFLYEINSVLSKLGLNYRDVLVLVGPETFKSIYSCWQSFAGNDFSGFPGWQTKVFLQRITFSPPSAANELVSQQNMSY